ncbi:hypothetical protein ACR30L_04505 [Psychromonas sp. PT13]|uniref:hypothetical protein n=1 Tax=Psychromonas sp. PT13 TaxID=3439547 RepID=UPI003EC0824A
MNLEHGIFTVTVDTNIIIITMKGSFNEFGARALIDSIKAKIKSFKSAKFSIIVEDLELEGMTPEGYKEINKYNEWLNDQNMIAKARVAKSTVTLDIDNRLIPAIKKQNIKIFEDVPTAIEWLKRQSE